MIKTFDEYIANYFSEGWLKRFRAAKAQLKSGQLSEALYSKQLDALVNDLSPQEQLVLERALQNDYRMPRFWCTRHFLARLLERFADSATPFLMAQIGALIRSCRRKKRERSSANGIVLVMNPTEGALITIFAVL